MKIGVISDTHLGTFGSGRDPRDQIFMNAVTCNLAEAGLFIHAGDVGDYAVIAWLETIAPVMAVSGNMDDYELCSILPEKQILEIEGFRIGITHGYGPPGGLLRYVDRVFQGEQLDCLIFGHSHSPLNEKNGGTLFFNPGSPTDKRFTKVNSLGILTVSDKLEGEIIYL